MPNNPTESGWYLLDGARRYWTGQTWHAPGQFAVDPGGQLPQWDSGKSRPPVDETMVTTLATLPGYRILAAKGVVTHVSAASAAPAKLKGEQALREAMSELRVDAAVEFNANAIVGLTVSTFGSSQGGALGDAVGVALAGTAVLVEPDGPGIPN